MVPDERRCSRRRTASKVAVLDEMALNWRRQSGGVVDETIRRGVITGGTGCNNDFKVVISVSTGVQGEMMLQLTYREVLWLRCGRRTWYNVSAV